MVKVLLGSVDNTVNPSIIIPTIATVLNSLIETTEKRLKSNNQSSIQTPFHSNIVSPISIEAYLTRLSTYLVCSGECFILMLIYIDRIIQYNPDFIVNQYSIHRLLLAGLIVSAKFHDEQYYNNRQYSYVGGIPLSEMNLLESLFLYYIRFDLHYNYETSYNLYYEEIKNHESRQNSINLFQSNELLDLVFTHAETKYVARRFDSDLSSYSSFSTIADEALNVDRIMQDDLTDEDM